MLNCFEDGRRQLCGGQSGLIVFTVVGDGEQRGVKLPQDTPAQKSWPIAKRKSTNPQHTAAADGVPQLASGKASVICADANRGSQWVLAERSLRTFPSGPTTNMAAAWTSIAATTSGWLLSICVPHIHRDTPQQHATSGLALVGGW